MNIKKLAIVLLASITLPAISLAADVGQCVKDIDAIQNNLDTGACLDNLTPHKRGEQICNRLDSKLQGANSKIESDKLVDKKVQDALDKLSSFQGTIDHLTLKGFVTPDEQTVLTGSVVVATTCVNGLFK